MVRKSHLDKFPTPQQRLSNARLTAIMAPAIAARHRHDDTKTSANWRLRTLLCRLYSPSTRRRSAPQPGNQYPGMENDARCVVRRTSQFPLPTFEMVDQGDHRPRGGHGTDIRLSRPSDRPRRSDAASWLRTG